MAAERAPEFNLAAELVVEAIEQVAASTVRQRVLSRALKQAGLQSVPDRIEGYSEKIQRKSLHLESRGGTEMTTDVWGSIIWSLCDGINSVQEIVDLIADAYDEQVESVRPHVEYTLRQLHLHGLIH